MASLAEGQQLVDGSQVAAPPSNLPFNLRGIDRLLWVGSSNWKDGEAAVHRRLTLERQVTGTLLPDCAIKPPAAEADQVSLQLPTRGRRVPYVYGMMRVPAQDQRTES